MSDSLFMKHQLDNFRTKLNCWKDKMTYKDGNVILQFSIFCLYSVLVSYEEILASLLFLVLSIRICD